MQEKNNDILALFASSRRHGNTGSLMDRVAGELGIEVVDLSEIDISPFDYEHRNRGDGFEPLMVRVLEFDKLIFASPIYWYAVASPMKVFLDRISDYLDLPDLLGEGRKLRGKTGYVLCTSVYDDPSTAFIDTFANTFHYLGMHYGGCLHTNCRNAYEAERHESDVKSFIRNITGKRAT